MSDSMDYNLLRNPNLELFFPFHDYDWARDMFDLCKATKVGRALSHLIAQWYKGSEAFRMPSLMMQAIKSTSDAYLKRKAPFFDVMFKALKYRLGKELKGSLSVTKQQEILGLLNKVESELQKVVDDEPEEAFDIHGEFAKYVRTVKEFGVATAATTEQAFCSIFFAYELFIKRCFQVMGGNKKIKASDKKFKEELERLLGNSMYIELWTCPEVADAREARHSLAHSDGEAGPNAQKNESYYLIDPATSTKPARMLIHTPGVHAVYKNLKDRAEKLARHIISHYP